jgi:hypothetical protein
MIFLEELRPERGRQGPDKAAEVFSETLRGVDGQPRGALYQLGRLILRNFHIPTPIGEASNAVHIQGRRLFLSDINAVLSAVHLFENLRDIHGALLVYVVPYPYGFNLLRENWFVKQKNQIFIARDFKRLGSSPAGARI